MSNMTNGVDLNEFFREATLRVCGDLALERALHSTLLYIREHLPADTLFVEYFDPGLGAARTIARADVSGGTPLDLITPIPSDAHAEREFQAAAQRGATIYNRPDEDALATHLLRAQGYDPRAVSLVTMELVSKAEMLGGLVVLVERRDAYEPQHAALLTTLAEPLKVAMLNALRHREVLRLKDALADDNRFLQRELHRISGDELVGADFGLKQVIRMVRQVAPTESPVLLTGETGVGKDVVANAIHVASSRRDGPFIAVNCGAIPQTLLDSELFGHEKGAFTGALAKKRGRFERAHHGTIFLDEIGEMPLQAQVRLLRVLQNREIERIGGTERVPVDIRVIAATHQDLQKNVRAGTFREDLWFRLNVFPIAIPPLRERPGDIPALVQHFVDRKARELKLGRIPELAPGAVDDLLAYEWPGNVRELENLIERSIILHRHEPLSFDLGGPQSRAPDSVRVPTADDELLPLDTMVEHHIRRALRATDGKIHGAGGAGELLGLNPNTLRAKMRKLGIPFGQRKRGT
jgi:transcriptional regulator with GAF, ATPase, and Fis domain